MELGPMQIGGGENQGMHWYGIELLVYYQTVHSQQCTVTDQSAQNTECSSAICKVLLGTDWAAGLLLNSAQSAMHSDHSNGPFCTEHSAQRQAYWPNCVAVHSTKCTVHTVLHYIMQWTLMGPWAKLRCTKYTKWTVNPVLHFTMQ